MNVKNVEMKTEIEIIDRIYYNIEDFCNANGKDITEYMADAVIERYNLDKYGDLNDKIIKKGPVKKLSAKKVNKKIEEPVIVEKNIETEIVKPITEEKNEPLEVIETPSTVEVVEEKPKRTRRTLKTK